jgi:gliding motility-associated-like protein
MFIQKIITFLILCLLSLQSFSQKEGLIWYFGYGAGLKFINGYPEALTNGSLYTNEGCSTISNAEGYLVLYTDGVEVYNRNHQIMQNGSGLLGDPSATQSGVIVPVPGNPELYYVFTVGNLDQGEPMTGFKYSLININMDGGLGAVVEEGKNIELIPFSTERVTAVQHHNKNGTWVIAQEWNSNNFYSYLITPEGLDYNDPVISEVGDTTTGDFRNGKGYMKVSSDGTMLAVAMQGKNKIQLFGFCDSTGVVSDLIADLPAGTNTYGVEFSKSAQFLYSTERNGTNVYQWNLQAGTPQDIINSRTVIGELASSKGGAMQMAPDGKIYIARQGKMYLSVINQPSKAGAECDFQEIGADLNGKLCQEGLPCFIQSYFNTIFIQTQNGCVFDTIYYSLYDTTGIDSVYWTFGDPASGANNHSTDFFPYHVYENPGKYNVHVTGYYLTTSTDANREIEIFGLAKVQLRSDTTICQGDSIILYANHDTGYIYVWNGNPAINKRRLTVKNEGLYWVEGTNLCSTATDSVYISVNLLPVVDLGEDTAIKCNSSLILDAGYWNDSFLWQDGSTEEYFIVSDTGTYWVDVFDELGCKSSDTISVKIIPYGIYLPTAFSPNDDGINDLFFPRISYEVDMNFEMVIYNRWGEQVFRTKDIKKGWDGICNGVKCPEEVYIWYVTAIPFEKNDFYVGATRMTGNVTLVR